MAEKVKRNTWTGGAQATAGQVRGRKCDIFPETTCFQDGANRLGGVLRARRDTREVNMLSGMGGQRHGLPRNNAPPHCQSRGLRQCTLEARATRGRASCPL